MTAFSLKSATRFYSQLLAYQYRDLPRASQFTELLAKQGLADLFALDVQAAYTIDTAIGAQLDVIGRYVGASRIVAVPIARPFFGFWDNNISDPALQNTNGFADSADPKVNAQAIFYQSQFVSSQNVALSDEQYRLVINLQIILNANDSSLAQIQDYLHTFFPGVVELVDNQDMTLTYTVQKQTPLPIPVLTLYLPKPAGVGRIVVVFDAVAAPASYTHTFHFAAPHTVTSDPVTVTVHNGTGPYTYTWLLLSSTLVDLSTPIANTPNSNVTTFTQRFFALTSGVSTWACFATDSAGLVAETNIVTITMGIDGPP